MVVQFKYIHLQHPAVALTFERIVLTASFPITAIMQTLGLAALVDPSDVPYHMAIILCTLYASLALPLPSSFFSSGEPEGLL